MSGAYFLRRADRTIIAYESGAIAVRNATLATRAWGIGREQWRTDQQKYGNGQFSGERKSHVFFSRGLREIPFRPWYTHSCLDSPTMFEHMRCQTEPEESLPSTTRLRWVISTEIMQSKQAAITISIRR